MANEQTRGMTDFTTQTSDTTGEAKSRAREVVQQAKERAGERIESRISDSKSRAAETLSGVASTLLSSSQQLREQHDGAGRAIERAAEGVDRFATYLQQTDVDDVMDQVYEFARRQPAAFIGGAFALGFIASRFIKATTPEHMRHRNLPATSQYGSGYETSYSSARGYEQHGYRADGDYRATSEQSSVRYGETATGRPGETRGTGDLGDGSPGVNDRTGGRDAGSR